MYKREKTKQVKVGSVIIGGQNKVVIQSMTTCKTSDVEQVLKEIKALTENGAELVRVSIFDQADAEALKIITKKSTTPIVADIHFNANFAIDAIKNGAKKIRINPGNISNIDDLKRIVDAAKIYNVAIRIGINGGSLSFEATNKVYKQMVKEAIKYIKLFEKWDFNNIVISLKHSNYKVVNDAYLLASKKIKYPLHIGVTEAGDTITSAIKSTLGLSNLLKSGIGDTIRISSNGNREDELMISKILLSQFDLYELPNVIACPICGRNQFSTSKWVEEITKYYSTKHLNKSIAIMGCIVNGLGEAKKADFTLCVKTKTKSTIYVGGKELKDVENKKALNEFIKVIDDNIKNV